ncbi:MAG: competence/damage-inducible protein A [Vicinamibacterales bacterium]
MNAWIVAVGSELLTPFKVDTNSLTITERLNAIGCQVRRKFVVGDHAADLADLFRRAIGRTDVLICTGGLGPTEDDITRDALALAFQLPLDEDAAILAAIHARFERRGMVMADINRRQAMVPRGAAVLENANGTAPGLWLEQPGTSIAVLPGPPREMLPMLERIVDDRLALRMNGAGLFRRVLKITGRPESDVDAVCGPIYSAWTATPVPIETTILAQMGQIELHLTATAPTLAVAEPVLDAAVTALEAALVPAVYSTDGRALEAVIGDLLRQRGLTVAVAESCSGGLLSSRLTDVPGSSVYFTRGAVCYSNDAKVDWLRVPVDLIRTHGAVSEPVAQAMAEGVRAVANATIGVGITGVAGPGGGTPEKPVGMVAIAVATGHESRVQTFQFPGARDMVKFQSAQAAMNMLRLMLTERPMWEGRR